MISNNDVVLVDENDNPIGTLEKVAAHLGDGKLHRAISVWIVRNTKSEARNSKQILNSNDSKHKQNLEILITKRSEKKMLWPGYWSNSVCSHPKEGESYVEAGERRLLEEVGIKCKPEFLYKFTYREKFEDVGSEHETTGVQVGKYDGEVNTHPDEMADYRWVGWEELMEWVGKEREIFTPWSLRMMENLELEKVLR